MEPKAARVTKVVINFIYGVAAVLLGLRFLFRLLDANVTGFVDFLYTVTNPLVAPFDAIFNSPQAGNGSVFDSAAVVALLIYGLLTWGLIALVNTVTTVAEHDQPQGVNQQQVEQVERTTTVKSGDDNQPQA